MVESELNKYINNPGLLNKDTLEGIKNLTEAYPYFQTAWIIYLKNLKVINHPMFKSELQKAAIRISDRRKLYRYLYPEKGNSDFILNSLSKASAIGINEYNLGDINENEGQEARSRNTLIDAFIATKPSISLKKEEEDIAEAPKITEVEDQVNDDLITETLANIFISQEKYGKAIDAFEKLSLKFPEKSSYFAARIDEINKLKNI